jgi:fructose-1,6-bisphosphatase/inositol monophosphatase family enzyme
MHIEARDIDFVIAVARGAGDLVRRMYASGQATVREKSSEIDLVTAADVAAEGFIRSALDRLYPGVALWGEESNQPPTQATLLARRSHRRHDQLCAQCRLLRGQHRAPGWADDAAGL